MMAAVRDELRVAVIFCLCLANWQNTFGLGAVSAEQNCGTFELRKNGKTLLCNKCQPGEHIEKTCSELEQTRCKICPQHTFNTECSRAMWCDDCKESCELAYGEMLLATCSPTSDNTCVCPHGMFRRPEDKFGPCLNHSSCGKGHGAVKGTRTADTQCHICASGTYSPLLVNFDKPCINWTTCNETSVVATPGNQTHDVQCKMVNGSEPSYDEVPTEPGLSDGAIAGILVGTVIFVLLVIGVGFGICYMRKRRTRERKIQLNGREIPLKPTRLENFGSGDPGQILHPDLPPVNNNNGSNFDCCADYLAKYIIGKNKFQFLLKLGLAYGAIERLEADYRDDTYEVIFRGIKAFEIEEPMKATPQYLIDAAKSVIGDNQEKMRYIEHLASELEKNESGST